jgi:hypothetical protein
MMIGHNTILPYLPFTLSYLPCYSTPGFSEEEAHRIFRTVDKDGGGRYG